MLKRLHFMFILSTISLASFAQVNLANGLMAYYPFNGTFNDASGTGNHGTGINGVTYGTDQWGNANNAAFFDGINDWISVPASVSITPGHQFSMAFRFKTTSSALQVLFSKIDYTGASGPSNWQYQVAINAGSVKPSNGLLFATDHTNTCTPAANASHYSYGDNTGNNQWYCVVLTFNNGVKKLYMNGVLISNVTVTGTANNTSIDSCPSAFRMGTWWQSDPRYFSGLIDEVRIWNRAINTQEIDSVCNLITVTDTIINKYAAVTSRVRCDNSFTVDTATGFAAGDTVLMIQMKGATIDTSNTASFGSVLSYNGAGNYEYNVVQAVSGNNITLKYQLLRSYDIPAGKVQLVKVPSYTAYTVAQKHTCLPWTGTKGGVFAIRVAGTLTLNADIDVSGRGFAGGQINNATTFSCDRTDYFYPLSGNDGGRKGEGIAEVSNLKIRGKGRLANGGGGGNNTNAGGGGGSNAGSGGAGGNQHISCNQSLISGGAGGVALTQSAVNNRLYLGGGGGCGHENNANTDPGGAGAGIVIINAATLAGNGYYIRANGLNCVDNLAKMTTSIYGDGQSGGGAGGSVLLKVASFTAAPFVEAKGGNGGNIYSTDIHGPGGGGGGGAVLFSGVVLPAANINTVGGINGRVINVGNTAHGAQPGQPGVTVSAIPYVFPVVTFTVNPIVPAFADSTVSCFTRKMINTSSGTGPLTYSWSFGGGATSTQQSPVYAFPGPGTHTVTLTVSDSNGCTGTLSKTITISPVTVTFKDSVIDCFTRAMVILSPAATPGLTYSWNFGNGNTANVRNPTHVFSGSGTYTVTITVTDSVGCTGSFSKVITIAPTPGSKTDTTLCEGKSVLLSASAGDAFSWSPATGLSNPAGSSTLASPTVTTTYIVTVNAGTCTHNDTFIVRVLPSPTADFSYAPTVPVSNTPVGFTNKSTNALTYTWSFGDGTGSTATNASHLYKRTGSYEVCLTAINGSCTDSVCQTVKADVHTAIGVPTGFTPNGDNTNDVLLIRGTGIETVNLVIYNRWGQKVFESNSLTQGWDGTYNGKMQGIDIYAYVLRATFTDGSSTIKKGNINLLR